MSPTHDPTAHEDDREDRARAARDSDAPPPPPAEDLAPPDPPPAVGAAEGGGGAGSGLVVPPPPPPTPGSPAEDGRDLSKVPPHLRATVFKPGQSGNPAGPKPKKHVVKLVERESARLLMMKYHADLRAHPQRVSDALAQGLPVPPPPRPPTRHETDLLIARAWLEMIIKDKNVAALSQYLDRHPDYGPVVQRVDQRTLNISSTLQRLWDEMGAREGEPEPPAPSPKELARRHGRTPDEEAALLADLEGKPPEQRDTYDATPPEVPEREYPSRPGRVVLSDEDIVDEE